MVQISPRSAPMRAFCAPHGRIPSTLRARGVCSQIPHSVSACAFLRSCLGRILYHFHLAQAHFKLITFPNAISSYSGIRMETSPARGAPETCSRRRTPRPPPSPRQQTFQRPPSFHVRGTSPIVASRKHPTNSRRLGRETHVIGMREKSFTTGLPSLQGQPNNILPFSCCRGVRLAQKERKAPFLWF